MNILLTVYGSAGDVHPMLGLALALQRRGHAVSLATSGYFAELVERAGIEFVELGTRERFLEFSRNPDLWHPIRSFALLLQQGILSQMREEYELVVERAIAGETVVLSSCLGFGSRIAHEKLGLPFITVHLQPSVMWTEHETCRYAIGLSGPRVPRWLKRLQFQIGQRLLTDRLTLPELNRFRRELGLPPVRHLVPWWSVGSHVLCLFPEWYAPPQPDWPRPLTCTQFPLWDEETLTAEPSELREFLDRFGPPIVFTPGSAMQNGSEFFREAVGACRRLVHPGILLTRFAEQIPADLPENVRHFSYVPFSRLLPRAAAIVHHGGIGTTAQALRAGIPQLLMPMSHDQPDNAARAQRFGVGDWLRPSAFRAAAIASKLERLLNSASVASACREIAARFVEVDPFAAACEVVESAAACHFSSREPAACSRASLTEESECGRSSSSESTMSPLTIEAVYENGVLKPEHPLPLNEHDRVRVTIVPEAKSGSDDWVQRTRGMMKWTGDLETLERLVMDPDLSLWAEP